MLEIWKAVGLWVLGIVGTGVLMSTGLFLQRAWVHINQPQSIMKVDGNITFDGNAQFENMTIQQGPSEDRETRTDGPVNTEFSSAKKK